MTRSTDDHGVHRALHRDPAGLALALPGVAVAEGEQRARHVDAEVAGHPGAHLRGVHVAAARVGDQDAAHLEVGRRDADGAVHRVQRQVHREVAVPGGEPAGPALRSNCQIQISSGSGSCSRAVAWVAVSAPKNGTVVDAAQSRAGSIETKCTASVSPGSAPSM